MRYAKLMLNDVVDGEGICVSFWTQGCPHKCYNCHNPETWNFNGGESLPSDIKGQITKAISANGITRNFSVLGGEPLCDENAKGISEIINAVREEYPNIKIFLWTGFTLEQLQKKNDKYINKILSQIDILIDGPFINSQRDLTLKLRGSRNQRILYKNVDF